MVIDLVVGVVGGGTTDMEGVRIAGAAGITGGEISGGVTTGGVNVGGGVITGGIIASLPDIRVNICRFLKK